MSATTGRDPAQVIRSAMSARAITEGGEIPVELLNLIKNQICRPRHRAATDDELAYFVAVCRQARLNPFARQIFAIFRKSDGDEHMSIQTSIDGFRLIAERTGKFEGYTRTRWCDADGRWHDVWLSDAMPRVAEVGVWKAGAREPIYGLAHLEMFRDERSPMWKGAAKVAHMLAKCAEALALRRAFPQELSGLYTEDESGAFDATAAPAAVEGSAAGELPEGPTEEQVERFLGLAHGAVERGLTSTRRLAMELQVAGALDTSSLTKAAQTSPAEAVEQAALRLADAIDAADADVKTEEAASAAA